MISAKAILDDFGRFEGSFAMMTDINERKEMELLLEETNRQLTELSNKDSLTGIANRRCFDATLQREYSRLARSKSKYRHSNGSRNRRKNKAENPGP